MSVSELKELLAVLREAGVTLYKTAELELHLEPAEAAAESTNAIGFAVDGPDLDPDEAVGRKRSIEDIIAKLGPDYVAARRAGMF